MKIEFETDEMTVNEMGAVRRLLSEAESIERCNDDDSSSRPDIPKKGDKK